MSGDKAQATPEIRDLLAAYQSEQGLTLKQLGAKVGKSESYVSRYLSDVAVGDVALFEQSVKDRLEVAKRKRTWEQVYFDTEAVQTCYFVFNLIREASDIGLITGPAGIGKTTASERYKAEHKTVISFSGEEGNGCAYGVMAGICKSLDMRKWNPREQRRSEFLREKLNGSERLILIDNAQRLNMSGLRWLFDFHDATGVSVALVGNPEVMLRLQGNDQMTSRIGFKQDIGEMIEESAAWLDAAADKMIAAMWPKAAKEVGLLARETARKEGHLRTLNKQIRFAIRLSETEKYRGNYGLAFVDARHMIGADHDTKD